MATLVGKNGKLYIDGKEVIKGPVIELCDCEHCRCPKLKGTGEPIPMLCVTCRGRKL